MHRPLLACATVALALTLPVAAHAQQAPVPPPPQGQGVATVDAQVQIGQPVQPQVQAQQPQPVVVQQPQPYVQQYAQPAPSPYYYMATRPMPYTGGPVPPGMHVEARPNVALIATGAAVFGAFYLFPALVGVAVAGAWAPSAFLAIPIAGPLIWAAAVNNTSSGSFLGGEAWSLGAILTIGQVVGAGLFIGGLAARREWLVPGPGPQSARRVDTRRVAWQFSPSAPGALAGFSLTATHF